MKTIRFTVLFLILSGFVFAGSKEDMEQLQRNVIELQQQFWNLENDLKANNASFTGAVQKVKDATTELQQNQAALNSKLETILNQVSALNEKLDETNRRIKDMTAQPMPVPGTLSGNVPDQGNYQANNPGSNPGMNPPPSGAMPSTSAKPAPTAAGAGDQQLFQTANAQYSKGSFEQALRGFQDLIDQHPNSTLADDAQYMIGQCFYSMKEYVDAVSEFDKVMKQYPESDNVPPARLKKGLALFALDKKGQGVVELQQLVQRYPNSKEAQIARQRLAELGLD
jgi:tol-pal system protein YbgF